MSKDQDRIIALQKQVNVARSARRKICDGRDAERIAGDALDEMTRLDLTNGLQGLVGHGENVR